MALYPVKKTKHELININICGYYFVFYDDLNQYDKKTFKLTHVSFRVAFVHLYFCTTF